MKELKFSIDIKSTTETAFQRAIFFNKTTKLDFNTTIEWLDMELPVNVPRTTGRGNCVDLIGRIVNSSKYVICELKFGKKIGDTPKSAAKELMGYFEAIKSNHKELDSKNLHHINGTKFSWKDLAKEDTMLIIASNTECWSHWLGPRRLSIPEEVYCYSVDVPANHFKLQKESAKGEKYTPSMDVENWDIISSPKE